MNDGLTGVRTLIDVWLQFRRRCRARRSGRGTSSACTKSRSRKNGAKLLSKVSFTSILLLFVHYINGIIPGTAESEEDINWESDEDESAHSTASNHPTHEADIADPDPTLKLATSRETLIPKKAPATSSSTPATGSPRLSSEGSYDVVSSQVSNAGDAVAVQKPGEGKEGAEDDEDSDWE